MSFDVTFFKFYLVFICLFEYNKNIEKEPIEQTFYRPKSDTFFFQNTFYHFLLSATSRTSVFGSFSKVYIQKGTYIMKELKALSAKSYNDSTESNFGDCFLINTGESLFIYDCGSENHAKSVIDYMKNNNFNSATFILSHNDDDHFKGLPYLIDQGKISKIYTTLLLKHVNEILNEIDDKRKTRSSVKNDILDKYDNIAKLTGCSLNDIFTESHQLINKIHDNISIVGPTYDYMISTVAKRLDGREGDTVNGETAVNATSIQLSVNFNGHSILLTGDSAFKAIERNLNNHDLIQLPHHGKENQAEQIFNNQWKHSEKIYIISDNTGNTNGGSDKLNVKGHNVHNTKNGDIVIDDTFFYDNSKDMIRKGSLCL